QSQELERRIAEQASVTSAVLDSRVRKQEETFSAQHEKLTATASAAQQQLTEAAANAQGQLQARLAEQVDAAGAQILVFTEAAVAKLKEGAAESATQTTTDLRGQIQEQLSDELQQRIAALRDAANAIAAETEQRIGNAQSSLLNELREHTGRVEQVMA